MSYRISVENVHALDNGQRDTKNTMRKKSLVLVKIITTPTIVSFLWDAVSPDTQR